MRILFITSNRLGDAVLSTGLLAALEARYPRAQFTIVCGPYAAGIFRAVPRLERLIVLNKKSWNRHWIGLWQECRKTRWDLAVDLRNSIATRLLAAEERAYGGSGSGQHKVIENATILGLSPPPAPHIWLDAQAEKAAAELLPPARPLLALAPIANWAAKQWPLARFAELAQRLTSPDGPLPNAPVLVVAGQKERDQVLPLLQAIPAARRVEIIGHDLLAVAACLKQARLFVGNDSGLMHMTAALGAPTLGLFGPGCEKIYGPWGPHGAAVRTPESRDELFGRLRRGKPEPNLMESLSVEKVLEAAKALIAKTAARP